MEKVSFKQFLEGVDSPLEESINDKGLFHAIFILGMPGAGKSYTAKNIGGSIQPRMVNSDRAVEHLLGKMDGGSRTMNKAMADEADVITKESLTHYINGMLPLMVDGTTGNVDTILRRKAILESIGYDCGMVFVHTSAEDAIKRVEQRELNGGNMRTVQRDFLTRVAEKSEQAAERLKGEFSFYKVVESVGVGVTDADITKLSGSMVNFYNTPLVNPVGVESVERVKEAGEKYLIPTVMSESELKAKTANWF